MVSIMGIILVLGMFLDGSAIALLTMPILAPLVLALGFDLMWFSVLFTMNTEIGLITPPVGMNLFVIQQISGVEAHEVLRGALPFVVVMALVLALVAFLPFLATWLPSTMG
jgi:C4-dicarboxylate transporter DctM subunit